MLSSRMIGRCGRAIVLVPVLAAIHSCNNPVCGCVLPPSISGEWAGRAATGDSLNLLLDHEPGRSTFTGTGQVGIAPPYQAVSVEGRVLGDNGPIDRFTLVGWRATPVEFVAHNPPVAYGRADGELRFGNGESTSLTLVHVSR
jgi:hypothetical protein